MLDKEFIEVVTSQEEWGSLFELGCVLGMSTKEVDEKLKELEDSRKLRITTEIVFPICLNPKIAATLPPTLTITKL